MEKEETEAHMMVGQRVKVEPVAVKVETPEVKEEIKKEVNVDDVEEEVSVDVQMKEVSEPTVSEPDQVREEPAQVAEEPDQEPKKRVRLGPLVPDTVIGESSQIISVYCKRF